MLKKIKEFIKGIKELWDSLPKTAKVFCYIAVSYALSELVVELKLIEQNYIVRVLVYIINLGIVFLEEVVPPTVNMVRTKVINKILK